MNGRREIGGTLSRGLQLQLLVLIFLVLAAVLLRVFASAWSASREAALENTAVQLCRNAAEAYAPDGELDAAAAALGGSAGETVLYFDRNGEVADAGKAALRLVLWDDSENTAAGALSTARFSAYDGENCLYELETQVYRPGA